MNRRDFVQHLALLAAGASALPVQLEAFTRLYDVNLPQTPTGLLVINEFSFGFSGMPRDNAALVTLRLGPRASIPIAMNTRGSWRQVAMPDCPMCATVDEVGWDVVVGGGVGDDSDVTRSVRDSFTGGLRCTDQNARIHNLAIDWPRRQLREYFA